MFGCFCHQPGLAERIQALEIALDDELWHQEELQKRRFGRKKMGPTAILVSELSWCLFWLVRPKKGGIGI